MDGKSHQSKLTITYFLNFHYLALRSSLKQKVSQLGDFFLVGAPGFEPGTSYTPCKRASRAAPRPDLSEGYYSPFLLF